MVSGTGRSAPDDGGSLRSQYHNDADFDNISEEHMKKFTNIHLRTRALQSNNIGLIGAHKDRGKDISEL